MTIVALSGQHPSTEVVALYTSLKAPDVSTLATLPPLALGQLVTIRSHGEQLPGTVVELSPLDDVRWEVRVEVLASFGVGCSRHVVDGRGRELDLTPRHPALVSMDH